VSALMPTYSDTGEVMGEPLRAEIACVETVIENEIAQGCTQKSVAMTYALALRSSWPVGFPSCSALLRDL